MALGVKHRRKNLAAVAAAAWLFGTMMPGVAWAQTGAKASGASHSGNAANATAEPSGNPYNDQLARLPPTALAARLARFVGPACIGSDPFLMGVTKRGRAKGYAYWSLRCAGEGAFLIQVTPSGDIGAMDCQTFKQSAEGRECYKAF